MNPTHDGALDRGQASHSAGDPPIESAARNAPVTVEQIEDSEGRSPHPKLLRLSAALGREAAAFARRYRYAGLGLIQLILSQNRAD